MLLKDIHLNIKKEYDDSLRMYFNNDFSLHKTMENHFETIVNNIRNDKTPLSIGFEELAEFYLMAALYAKIFCEDKVKVQHLLRTATWYSYNLIKIFNTECASCHMSILLMRKAVYLWSSLFLVDSDEKAMQIGAELIDSLNDKGSIIRYGCRLYPESWFLIDLYAVGTSTVYDNERVDYPEDMSPYNDILKEWDTLDLLQVDLFVSMLAEMHLLIEDEEPTEEYLNFSKSIMKLYPYEILVYLNFRRIKGLENPKEFTHPLMNTPIAKIFLEIKEPLPKPKDLPYVKELLTKLNEKCPNVKIPQEYL
ncbi:hypothetical protein JHD50_04080 [Sulfurimonas sp. MAG313]|nr:hypothetical protein [Sulfurimonas sp. MAG313]MDF1880489.1 hypothetical protein [Sulfurimonas sp. MAG313]